MSKQQRKYRPAKYLFVVSCVFLVSFIACKKDSGLGSNVLPANDLLSANFNDTTTVLSSIKLKDSVITTYINPMPLGSYFDPVFGPTKSSIYMQILPPGGQSIYSFGAGYALDSVVLDLPIYTSNGGIYGTLMPQTVTVDTITNSGALVSGKAYYSDTNVSHGTAHIGMATIVPNPSYSPYLIYGIDSGTVAPCIRIKLNNSFGNYIMYQNTTNTNYQTNFGSLLKGLYISVNDPGQLPGQGGIIYIDPNLPGAGMTFYYKIGGVKQSIQTFQFSGVYFCHFDHDYSATPFYAAGKDSVLSPNVCYVQALAGVKTQLSFPFLSNWKNLSPVAINIAEVIIPVNVNATGSDIPPQRAYLVGDSAGHEFALSDQSLITYGGTYDAFNHQYVFNLARYFQGVIDGKITDRGLYFIAGNDATSANGAVLYGVAKNSNSPRIRLKMYYTPLKH